ncbi:MAG: GMC family oxidoreductase [Pseudohongiellaceae bacterium]
MPATFDLNDNSVVVVIGSGAGGGTVAQQLTARGIKVVCLEAGPRRSLSDIVNNEPEMFVKLSWLDRRIGEGYAPDGMPVWSVKGVGGTTTHWTACCPRLHDFEFRSLSTYGALPDCNLADWPVSLDDMAPWYDRAEDMLGVTGTHGIERLPPSANFKVMEAAARAVGYTDIDTYNMAINSAPRDGRPACLQMGFCNSGCAINAKWTTLFNHIPQAEATDFFDLRPECMVTRIVTDADGRASAVRYRDRDGVEHEQKARVVCVAANVVETTRLLLNSANERFPNGLANSSDQVGRNYMRHVMAMVFGVMPGVVNWYKGTTCAGVIRDEVKHDPSRGFSGGFQYHLLALGPEYIATNLVPGGWGKEYAELLRDYDKLSGVIITGEDPPQQSNRITLHATERDQHGLPVPVVSYRKHANTEAMLQYAYGRARAMYEALGATRTFTHEGFGATHNMGVCRMGNDPATSVTNSYGQTHDIPNLFVSDGSLFTTSSSANPTLTIISLMLRQADYLARELSSGAL